MAAMYSFDVSRFHAIVEMRPRSWSTLRRATERWYTRAPAMANATRMIDRLAMTEVEKKPSLAASTFARYSISWVTLSVASAKYVLPW